MRALILLMAWTSFGFGATAWADGGRSTWLNVEYTYSDYTNKESGMSETGRLAGVRGELGILLGAQFGVSVGGEYQDGNLNFDGTTLAGNYTKQLTADYFRDTRLLMNYYMGALVFSSGIVQRERYENLPGNYHRRDTFTYYPVIATYYSYSFYFKVEIGASLKGKTNVSMSEVTPSGHDLEFARSSGSGLATEAGYIVPTGGKFATRMFLSYRRLSLGDAGTQNDGVRNVTVTQMSTDIVQAGIGVGF